jgi:ABC-2 type transport system permease protein
MGKKIVHIVVFVVSVLALNYFSEKFFFRVDLTSEKRYSLSENTKHLLSELDEDLVVTIYLDGDLNSGFLRLRKATKELFEEFRAYAGEDVVYQFVNPSSAVTNSARDKKYEELEKKGMRGILVHDKTQEGESSQKVVFPWVELSYKGKNRVVNLLKNIPQRSGEENLNSSIETLEYEITDALRILTTVEIPKVAFLEGHGELAEPFVYDISRILSKYYQVDRGAIIDNPEALFGYEALIVAAPTTTFSEKDKYALDQYIMQGGKVLWLIDGAKISLDSLSTASQTVGVENDLNLSDQLFKYGVRINADLVQDVQCVLIPVNMSRLGDAPKYEPMPWYYSPLVLAVPTHSVSKNLSPVKTEFVSSLSFVNPDLPVKKTPLLVTSTGTHIQNIPSIVSMDVINVEKNGYYFNTRNAIVGAVLEGEFPSVFTNRMMPEGIKTEHKFLSQSKPTKMIVVADGDIIRNDIQGYGQNMNVLPLGYDRYMNQQFGNSDFILNAVNYLTDDDGWMELRSREIKLRLLNRPAVIGQRTFWQMINVLLPLFFLAVFAALFLLIRKRKYTSSLKYSVQKEEKDSVEIKE